MLCQNVVILKEPFGSARPELVEGLRINFATEESGILHYHYVSIQNDQQAAKIGVTVNLA